MNAQTKRPKSHKIRVSILVKSLAIVAAATLLVAGVLTIKADQTVRAVSHEGLVKLAHDVTKLTANQLEGAVRFGKVDIVDGVLENLIDDHSEKIDTILVVNADGEVISEVGLPANDDLSTLAATAKLTGQLERTGDLLWVAMPIGQAADGGAMGALAIRWTNDAALASLSSARMTKLWTAGLVFIAALAASGLFFKFSIASPVAAIARRTSDMAAGDLESSVKGQDRRDELGLLASELDALRLQLGQAEAQTRDAKFQSAGFLGSSAALVMTTSEYTITHANPAFLQFIKNAADHLLVDKSTSPDELFGQTLTESIHGFDEVVARNSGNNDPFVSELRFGASVFQVEVNSVNGSDGSAIGYIFEWSDVTASRRNQAVLDALENGQLTADFDGNGVLIGVGETMRSKFPGLEGEIGTLALSSFIEAETHSFSSHAIEESIFDKFTVTFKGQICVASGSIAPIRDRSNNTVGMVFMGNDITESERAKKLAKEQAEAKDLAQKQVVESLSTSLTTLAEGDLTVRLTSAFADDYESLRSHFNASVNALDSALKLVLDNSGAILGEAGNISSAADDLSRRTEQQAATLEEFAAALTEITASVASAAEGASKASDVVTDARKNAEASGTVVREAVDAMGEIASSSDQISRIISVIDDIAFQTNLLALNAGVEAARAGDAGRGFAVVASEVRALAQRSSDAAREINTLISTSGSQVKRGVELVDKAGNALTEIVTSVGDIEDHVTGIAASAREQSTGLEEINTAISQLDQVTQQNVAMFEETTAATHTLTSEANALVATTSNFRTSGASNNDNDRTVRSIAPKHSKEAPSPREALHTENARSTGYKTAGNLALEDDDDNWEDF